MHREKTPILICVSMLLLMSMPAFSTTVAVKANSMSTNVQIALDYISHSQGVLKERLMVENERFQSYPLLGKTIWSGKIWNELADQAYGVSIDEKGTIVNIRAIREANRAAFAQKYGKLHPTLHRLLQGTSPDEILEVAVWLTSHETSREDRVTVSISNKESFTDFLKAQGFDVTYVSTSAPLVFVRLPAKAIAEIQDVSEVDTIYNNGENEPLIHWAAETERADLVWAEGVTGSHVLVAVVEGDNIQFANPYLKNGLTKNTSVAIGYHATAVAGIINSDHYAYKGIAHGSYNSTFGLLSAGADDWYDSDLIEAEDWAIANGARVINNSWGERYDDQYMELIDRYVDWIVRNNAVTVVNAAGNAGYGVGYVASPASSYNGISVGAFEDQNTSPGAWGDDKMSSYSSTKDPWADGATSEGDREKPEVVAVGGEWGQPMKSTLIGPITWIGTIPGSGIGTSFAAPSVAGEAALLMETYPVLMNWPEPVKAIIMATAWHNLEGNNALSEYDGAGGVDMWRAYKTVLENQFAYGELYDTLEYWNYTFSIPEGAVGDSCRVALCWDSNPSGPPSYTSDPLDADLDLRIKNPAGSTVASSASNDNNYEIVEFVASSSGTYTAQVRKIRFDGASEYFGLAWDHIPRRKNPSYLSLEITPSTVARGSTVTMSGQLFPTRHTDLYLYYQAPGSSTWKLGPTISATAGSYMMTATVPTTTAPGIYKLVVVWWGDSTYSAAASEQRTLTIT